MWQVQQVFTENCSTTTARLFCRERYNIADIVSLPLTYDFPNVVDSDNNCCIS